jgi:hypothetical protein
LVQVLLLLQIQFNNNNKIYELALVKWYNYKYENTPNKYYKYGCPLMKFIDQYNLIPLSSIKETVHVIPRFDRENSYFINKYIF